MNLEIISATVIQTSGKGWLTWTPPCRYTDHIGRSPDHGWPFCLATETMVKPLVLSAPRGQACLLCYVDKADRLLGYGWIQNWLAFRRKFVMLSQDAVMLGKYWTAPEYRGQGHLRKAAILQPSPESS